MKKLLLLFVQLIVLFACEVIEEDVNACNTVCSIFCQSGYVLDDNGCETCECVDYRDQYIGQWEFTKYMSVSHPYDSGSSDQNWIGEITNGSVDSTLFIPNNPILDGSNYCFCYEFQIMLSGEIKNDAYDADDFNYYFDGFITSDSLYFTSVAGSPFSTTSQTIYGKKLN